MTKRKRVADQDWTLMTVPEARKLIEKARKEAYISGLREGANQTRKRIRAKIRRMLQDQIRSVARFRFAETLSAWILAMDERSRKRKGGM